jgi:hypothetical protein
MEQDQVLVLNMPTFTSRPLRTLAVRTRWCLLMFICIPEGEPKIMAHQGKLSLWEGGGDGVGGGEGVGSVPGAAEGNSVPLNFRYM